MCNVEVDGKNLEMIKKLKYVGLRLRKRRKSGN